MKTNNENAHTSFFIHVIRFSIYRFLSTGETFHSLAFSFRISPSWISKIVKEVFETIKRKMLFLMPSPTRDTFVSTEKKIRERWNFPNVVGCLDGKHVRIWCPDKSGSLYFNYKNYYSIILFALTDANYKFMAIDVGSFGREGDAGKFLQNSFFIFMIKLMADNDNDI